MPIYEYRCGSCGHELEALQKFSDSALTTCPSCRAETLVKRVSAAGFQLKGTGWYATDFKGNGKSTSTKEAKDKGGDGAGGGAAAGDKSEPSGATKSGEGATAAKSEAKDTGASGGSATPPTT